MEYRFNDGGRAAAGYKGRAGDCVARAVAIASGKHYAEVYAALCEIEGGRRQTKRMRKSPKASARNGVYTRRQAFKDYMVSLGFEWTPTMQIGSGCKVHLNADELPSGRLVVMVSKHATAVLDGVIHDTYNPSERGTTVYPQSYPADLLPKGARPLPQGGFAYAPERCVYGFWKFTEAA